jgi:L-aspartate oxidase
MSAKPAEFLRQRFPTIYQTCERFGLDISRDPIPVSPACHYFMGGVRTDLWGRTTMPGLYAAGEVSCTGVHGANRLASNSLLEGLVFGARAGETAAAEGHVPTGARIDPFDEPFTFTSDSQISTAVRKRVKRIMWERVGILRDRGSLERALNELETISRGRLSTSSRSFVTLAKLVAQGAIWREESRGGHYRTDFPEPREEFRVHSIQEVGKQIGTAQHMNFDSAQAA